MSNLPIVSICCLSYNHEPYIKDCLNGFMNQKTNFSFEVLIHDDASTDGTADIIQQYEKKYPSVIKPILQTDNQYSKGIKPSLTYNYPRAQGKYIALCEGDDYWTDPLKLQKQVDFLEANEEYGLVYSDYLKYKQDVKKFLANSLTIRDLENRSSFEDLLKANCIQTLTVCLRKKIILKYLDDIKPFNKNWLLGDYPIWLYTATHYKIKYLPNKMAVYRMLNESATFSKDREKEYDFVQSINDVRLFFMSKYGVSHETRKFIYKDLSIQNALRQINIGFDKKDPQKIEDAISIKKNFDEPVTLLDKYKHISSKNIFLWYFSRFLLRIKIFLDSKSTKYIDIKAEKSKPKQND